MYYIYVCIYICTYIYLYICIFISQEGPLKSSPAKKGPGGPTKAQGGLHALGPQGPGPQGHGPQRPGPQGPRGAHKGLAHKRPGRPTRARPPRAKGSPQGPRGAHKGPAHKGPGAPQGPREGKGHDRCHLANTNVYAFVSIQSIYTYIECPSVKPFGSLFFVRVLRF